MTIRLTRGHHDHGGTGTLPAPARAPRPPSRAPGPPQAESTFDAWA